MSANRFVRILIPWINAILLLLSVLVVSSAASKVAAGAYREIVLSTWFTPTLTYTYYLPGVFNNYSVPVWEYIGPTGIPVKSIATAPQEPGTLYIGTTDHGVYQSLDYGLTWSNKSHGLPITVPYSNSRAILHLAVDPTNALNVYASTRPAPHIFWSNDGGDNWFPGGETATLISDIIVDPFTPTMLYVGTGSFGMLSAAVLRSSDAGLTWEDISPGRYYGRYSLAISSIASELYCASPTPSAGFYKSFDNGTAWEQLASVELRNITNSPHNTQTLYSTEQLVTYDGGITWGEMEENGLPDRRMEKLVASTMFTQVLYAAFDDWIGTTLCAGVYVSLDDGQSWNPLNAGLGDFCVGDIALASDASYLYAATGDGLWRYNLVHFRLYNN